MGGRIALVLALAALASLPAWFAAAGETGEIEEVEEVTEVAAVASGTPAGPQGLADLIGRMHPAAVHLPIGWITMLLLLDLATFLGGRPWHGAGLFTGIGALLACGMAAATGSLREEFLEEAGIISPVVESHETLAFATAGLLAAALGVRLTARGRPAGSKKGLYLLLVAAAALAVGATGHLGGRMVFGEGYLPF